MIFNFFYRVMITVLVLCVFPLVLFIDGLDSIVNGMPNYAREMLRELRSFLHDIWTMKL
jgi:hypothetical protein